MALNPEKYFEDMERVWRYLKTLDPEGVGVKEVLEKRGYLEGYRKVLEEVEFLFIPENTVNISLLKKVESFPYLGLGQKVRRNGTLTETGKFLLEGRYVFPIRSVKGKIFALVGWYPDQKKYITTPSALFSKNMLYFGLEQMGKLDQCEKGNKPTLILVEGIFDALALRTLELKDTVVLATMGADVSGLKKEIYPIFKRVLALPDRDSIGRKTVREDLWGLPVGSSYLRLVQNSQISVEETNIFLKDIDDVVKLVDEESLRDFFESLYACTTLPRVTSLKI